MRTLLTTHFFCNTAYALLMLATVSPAWAADGGIDPADSPIASAGETFTKTLKIDTDAPKAVRWDVYLSGYAYHDRDTYTEKQLRKMNETTVGGGIGRTLRNERGNDESIYAMGIRDSNNHPQWMAGYSYQWIFPVKSKSFEIGAGLTALIISRHDWYNGRPFPALLPVASMGTRNARLLATYVPHLSARKAKGNILQVMLQLSM